MNKLSVISLLCLGSIINAQMLPIATHGTSPYVIVIPDNPASVLKSAATELAEHLKAVTGHTYPVYATAQRPAGHPAFVIGALSSPSHDAIAIHFKDNDIYLNGQMPRGPLYAVYTFLEDYVGIRWWTSSETFIPQKPDLAVHVKDHDYAPPIFSREAYYRDAFNTPFGPRLKLNGHSNRISEDFGGHRDIIGFVHTSFQFLPPKKYFEQHPEWYSEINGKRTVDRYTQLCLTNEEMRREFVKVCLQKIAENPTAGMISVSQNDGRGIDGGCQCAKCRALEEHEGSPSGPWIHFVNAVAADIAKVYPDFLVETLAYRYTRKAPRHVKPADNVVVRLCSIEMNFAQPLETGPANANFKKDIEEWSAISKHLYIWNYITNFSNYMLPHPNYRGLAPDLRFFVKHHAIGLFEQGDAHCKVGDFVRPRTWIVAHLLWNPNLDEKQLAREYFNGYYGAAGPFLLDYLDFLCDNVTAANYNLTCYNNDVDGWLKPQDFGKAYSLYAKAEAAVADNPQLAARVRRERLTLDLAALMTATRLASQKRFIGQSDKLDIPDPMKLADEFVALTQDAGYIREGGAFGNYGDNLRQSLKSALNEYIPAACKGLPPRSWDVFTVASYQLVNTGTWVSIVPDANALQKIAARMPPTHHEWAIQHRPSAEYYDKTKRWRLKIRVRCDAAVNAGPALSYGLYDLATSKDMIMNKVMVNQCRKEQYVEITTEPFDMPERPLVWFAPVNRSQDELQAVYVDEALFIQENPQE